MRSSPPCWPRRSRGGPAGRRDFLPAFGRSASARARSTEVANLRARGGRVACPVLLVSHPMRERRRASRGPRGGCPLSTPCPTPHHPPMPSTWCRRRGRRASIRCRRPILERPRIACPWSSWDRATLPLPTPRPGTHNGPITLHPTTPHPSPGYAGAAGGSAYAADSSQPYSTLARTRLALFPRNLDSARCARKNMTNHRGAQLLVGIHIGRKRKRKQVTKGV